MFPLIQRFEAHTMWARAHRFGRHQCEVHLMKGVDVIKLKEREAGDSWFILNVKIGMSLLSWTTY